MKRDIKREIYLLIVNLIKIRDDHSCVMVSPITESITSISYNGKELSRLRKTIQELESLETLQLEAFCIELGYPKLKQNIKPTITINKKRFLIKNHNYSFALKNHATRDKYMLICNTIGTSFETFDQVIDDYWRKRHYKIINEDTSNDSEYSPFKSYKNYFSPIFTEIAFSISSKDSDKNVINYILDYTDPLDFKTWKSYNRSNYIHYIWDFLCFSFRGDRGMPTKYDPTSIEYNDIHPWTHIKDNYYKGALHIRVKGYNSEIQKTPAFLKKRHSDIERYKQKKNKGELDEILIKILFIKARMDKSCINCGKRSFYVYSVKDCGKELPDISYPGDILKLSIPEILAIQEECNINKTSKESKADIFINNIGISLKSKTGGNPSIINHTHRKGFINLLKRENLGFDISTIDPLINKYWELREAGTGEDIPNTNLSPFFDSSEMKKLVTYFAFDGTASYESKYKAQFVLHFNLNKGKHIDFNNWILYGKNHFIDLIWNKLIFSVRSKGLTKDKDNKVWIRMIDKKEKGTLSVRLKK